eukprot:scaffold2163_cov120-Isochrysis_galbana.AAC.10
MPEPEEGEAWVARTQLARASGYIEPWSHPPVAAMRKIVTTLLSVISGISEEALSEARLSGTHAGRHTMTEVVARLGWRDDSDDSSCLGDWAPNQGALACLVN